MNFWVRQDYDFDIMIETIYCTYGTMGETRSSVCETMSETIWSVLWHYTYDQMITFWDNEWGYVVSLWHYKYDQMLHLWH
jgi:hypothetical protein